MEAPVPRQITFDQYHRHTGETTVYPGSEDAFDPEFPNQGQVLAGMNYAVLGLVGEVGEIPNKLKKVYRDDDGALTPEKVDALKKEIGDALWYLDRLAFHCGTTLADVAVGNVLKLRGRKDRGTIAGDGDDR